MLENVDRWTDAGVTGKLLAHPSVFGSGELKIMRKTFKLRIVYLKINGCRIPCTPRTIFHGCQNSYWDPLNVKRNRL